MYQSPDQEPVPVERSPRVRLAARGFGQRLLAGAMAVALLAGGMPATMPVAQAAPRSGSVDAPLRAKAAANPNALIPVLIQRQTKNGAEDAIRAHGGTLKRHVHLANAVAATVPARELDKLAHEPGVVRISYDMPVKQHSTPSPDPGKLLEVYPNVVQSSTLWNSSTTAQITTTVKPTTSTSTTTSWTTSTTTTTTATTTTMLLAPGPLQGRGVTVAVLDSGLVDHPDFHTSCAAGVSSRVLNRVAIALDDSGGPDDDNGHGTFVSSVLAGNGCGDPSTTADDSNYVGAAPSANLVSIKVSDATGLAHVSDVIAGIEWAAKNAKAYNIRVLNLSLGAADLESYKTSLLDAAVELAWLQGLVVVVSAGNSGPNAAISAPANDPYVIAVGATDDNGTVNTANHSLAAFSSYGTTSDGFSKPDLVAPGRHIIAAMGTRNGSLLPLSSSAVALLDNHYYAELSGTSFSAPVVSGVVAQLLQARPQLYPGEVKWVLRKTARPLPFAGTGAGYPQAWSAAYYPGIFANSNMGLTPNDYVERAFGSAMGWNTTGWDQVSWDNVSWDNESWDNVSWDNVSWDNVSWDNVSWDSTAGSAVAYGD